MPFPCKLNVYITVEAVTLIGLSFVAATSFLVNTIMAKRKKTGSSTGPKPPQLPQAQQQQPQQQQQQQQQQKPQPQQQQSQQQQKPQQQQQPAKAVVDAKKEPDVSGSVQQQGTVPLPAPVIEEVDLRPETS